MWMTFNFGIIFHYFTAITLNPLINGEYAWFELVPTILIANPVNEGKLSIKLSLI